MPSLTLHAPTGPRGGAPPPPALLRDLVAIDSLTRLRPTARQRLQKMVGAEVAESLRRAVSGPTGR